MNRIVIIGNGFDLAHGLKTSYKDFIGWYWKQKILSMATTYSNVISDILCELKSPNGENWNVIAFNNDDIHSLSPQLVKELISDRNSGLCIKETLFFEQISRCIENKGWVDIENEYYLMLQTSYIQIPQKLNEELDFIKRLLSTYLQDVQNQWIKNFSTKYLIKRIIFEPIKYRDIAVNANLSWRKFIDTRTNMSEGEWKKFLNDFQKDSDSSRVHLYIQKSKSDLDKSQYDIGCNELTLPDKILLLNFNYTNIADSYLPMSDVFPINHIHGNLKDSESIIFGYGDELDESYKKIINKNENVYLQNIKSIKYLESDNYRKLLQFIESDAYQIYIMGHSCGNSDRTLLNTLFEHPNCVSIKPFYFLDEVNNKDNYTDIVQNISRNFTDMKLMRDRVVNKTYCEPFSIKEK